MTAVEELEVQGIRGDAGGDDRVAERDRAEVEVVLVVAAGVDPDRSQARAAPRRARAPAGRDPSASQRAQTSGHELAGVEAERELDACRPGAGENAAAVA